MTHLFDDITLSDGSNTFSYTQHALSMPGSTHRGFATAALVAVWMLGTDEAERRGLTSLDTAEERLQLMTRYEQETLRDDGGLLQHEIEELYWWLWAIYAPENNEDDSICPIRLFFSQRQLSLWATLFCEYMSRLVEQWADSILHAEDTVADCRTGLEWLLMQMGTYTRIQHLRGIEWHNYDQVRALFCRQETEEGWMLSHIDIRDIVTHLPAQVSEQDCMDRYFTLRRIEHAERPVMPTGAEWYAAEQQPLDAHEILPYLTPHQLSELHDYQRRWLRYLSRRLKLVNDPKAPVIWTELVTPDMEQKLITHLQNHEEEANWCQQITAAIMAMKIRNLVRRDLTVSDFRKWASYYLHKDYSSPSVRTQLARKWNSWNRLDTEVQNHIRYIQNYD